MDASKFLSWLPGWLGFLLLIITGVVLIVAGAVTEPKLAGYFIAGAFAITIGAFSWIVGGVSRVKGRVGDIGVLVEVSDLPWWGWLVDGGLVAVAVAALVLTG